MPRDLPVDPIAETYVELTVAIVTLQEQVATLAAQLQAVGRHQVALARALEAITALEKDHSTMLRALVNG